MISGVSNGYSMSAFGRLLDVLGHHIRRDLRVTGAAQSVETGGEEVLQLPLRGVRHAFLISPVRRNPALGHQRDLCDSCG